MTSWVSGGLAPDPVIGFTEIWSFYTIRGSLAELSFLLLFLEKENGCPQLRFWVASPDSMGRLRRGLGFT